MRTHRKKHGIWYLITEIQPYNGSTPEPIAIIPVWGEEHITLYSHVLAKYMSDDVPERLRFYDNLIKLHEDFVKDWILGISTPLVIEQSIFAIQPVTIDTDHTSNPIAYLENLQKQNNIELFWDPVTFSYLEFNSDEWSPFNDYEPYDNWELSTPDPVSVDIASPESIDSALMHVSPFRYINEKLHLINPELEQSFGPLDRILGIWDIYIIYPERNNIGGIVDNKGKFILPPEYNIETTGRIITFSKEGLYGLYDWRSKLLVPPEWDEIDISSAKEHFVRLRRRTIWYYIDILGKSYPISSLNSAMKIQLPLLTIRD